MGKPAARCYEGRQVRRRLIVNADDFGRVRSINGAVIQAHREGVLTTASLMVNETAVPKKRLPLARELIPARESGFTSPSCLDVRLFRHKSRSRVWLIPGMSFGPILLANRLIAFSIDRSAEATGQTEVMNNSRSFRATGLPLDHVNGHLHMHLHPVVFRILMEDAAELGVGCVRLTADPFWLNLRLAKGQLVYRLSHAIIFQALAARARRDLEQRGFRHTQRVFGLLQNARVDEDYVIRLLAQLPAGDSELYSHPSLDNFKNEFAALVSPRVRQQIEARGIQLIRYHDL